MQHEAEGAGRLNPAQALVDLPAQSQDKPSTGVSILGKDEDNPATHTVPLYTPTIPGYTGEDSQELRESGNGRAKLCPLALRTNTCSLGTLSKGPCRETKQNEAHETACG